MTCKTYEVKVYDNGKIEWQLDGKYHREDGPAIIRPDGTKYWCKNGEYHREDGPAVIWPDGIKEWYLNGERYTEKEFNAEMQRRNSPSCDGKIVEIEGKKYRLQEVE